MIVYCSLRVCIKQNQDYRLQRLLGLQDKITGFSYRLDYWDYRGFPTFHHNEVRDLTATLLTEVCHNEPPLHPITTKTFPYATANNTDDACLDVKARVFWCRGQDAFFDVARCILT